ncbi:hypothetical protein ACFL9S_11915 [Erwinia sp. AnSW2-5]|uniref:hypothetical protein n=1 Tax=Erwinia sp. AnSW2-5 TaxID=3367692 RepID=UPI00385D7488
MDNRVGKLEGHVGVLQQDVGLLKHDVSRLKDDVRTLKEDVSELKKDVGTLKIDVAVIKSNYATREDIMRLDKKIDLKMEGLRTELHKSLALQTKWFASSQLGLLALGLGLAKLLF